jgi:hypothetical protein
VPNRELVYIDAQGNYGDARGLILLNLAEIHNGERLFDEALDRGESIRLFVLENDWDIQSVVVRQSSMLYSTSSAAAATHALQSYEERGGRN